MSFNAATAKKLLERSEFEKFFIEELGWDRHSAHLPIPVSGTTFKPRGSNVAGAGDVNGYYLWVETQSMRCASREVFS